MHTLMTVRGMVSRKFFHYFVIVLLSAHEPLHAADANADWQRVVAAAKKEGKVVIGAPPGSDFRIEAQAALKKRFDLDSEFIQAPGPSLMSKIVAEKQARGFRRCVLDWSVHRQFAAEIRSL